MPGPGRGAGADGVDAQLLGEVEEPGGFGVGAEQGRGGHVGRPFWSWVHRAGPRGAPWGPRGRGAPTRCGRADARPAPRGGVRRVGVSGGSGWVGAQGVEEVMEMAATTVVRRPAPPRPRPPLDLRTPSGRPMPY
ncbi:hypothetical protein Kpho02_37640 [Kitasatospora phosalacinea]|uniref:Uncharacterized protein n=1 Tax=Kitasatospora phosalacinea TaxID=2065 RepID=A0A9W6V3V2_9ACTN|nr:hypothetical protein Kpho02_37640 [Kitasatospora phosalacinea]